MRARRGGTGIATTGLAERRQVVEVVIQCEGLCGVHDSNPLQPYQRTAEVLNERAGLAISPGTLQRTVRVVAARLEAPVIAIRDALVAAPVAHADETGRRGTATCTGYTYSAPTGLRPAAFPVGAT